MSNRQVPESPLHISENEKKLFKNSESQDNFEALDNHISQIQQKLKDIHRNTENVSQDLIKSQIEEEKNNYDLIKKEHCELKLKLVECMKNSKKYEMDYQLKELENKKEKVHCLRMGLDDIKNFRNQILEKVQKNEQIIRDIFLQQSPILTNSSPLTREIQQIEKKLDDTIVKYNENSSIGKKYEAILRRLQRDQRGFDQKIRSIEFSLREKKHDYFELKNMYQESKILKEKEKSNLHRTHKNFREMLKRNNRELNRKLQIVKDKLENSKEIKNKKKTKKRKGGSKVDPKIVIKRSASYVNREMKKLARLEEKWRKTKNLTGGNNLNEVIQKYFSSADLKNNLKFLEKEVKEKLEKLNDEKRKFIRRLTKLKLTKIEVGNKSKIQLECNSKLLEKNNNLVNLKGNYEELKKINACFFISMENINNCLCELFNLKRKMKTTSCDQISTILMVTEFIENAIDITLQKKKKKQQKENAGKKIFKITQNNVRVNFGLDEKEGKGESGKDLKTKSSDVLDRKEIKFLSRVTVQRELKNHKKEKDDNIFK